MSPPSANQFFRNRPAGVDVAVQGIAYSYYDFHRFQAYYSTSPIRNGPLPFFPLAELNLLRHIGRPPAPRIQLNITSVPAALPPVPK